LRYKIAHDPNYADLIVDESVADSDLQGRVKPRHWHWQAGSQAEILKPEPGRAFHKALRPQTETVSHRLKASKSDKLNHHFVIALPLDQYKTTASEARSESPLPIHDTHPANLSRVCRRAAVPPSNFLKRPEIHTTIPPTPILMEMAVKIMVELLSVLALASKQIKQRRFSGYALTYTLFVAQCSA
jgi:hypothetical protein